MLLLISIDFSLKLGYLVSCRPLLETHIKKPYERVLLLVVSLVANSVVNPLGVIDVENEDNKKWFIHAINCEIKTDHKYCDEDNK